MKKIPLLILLILSANIFSSTGLLLSEDNWYSEIDVPVIENLYITANLTDNTFYAGPSVKFNWEDYTTGLLKVKTGNGFVNGGLLFGSKKYMLFGKYMSNSNKAPVFSYNYMNVKFFSDMTYSLYTRSWYRLPLGAFNGGMSYLNYRNEGINFTDMNFYVYSKAINRSTRLRSFDDTIGAAIDIKSTDSLGEMGYGAGLALDYKKMDVGVCLTGSFILPLEEFKMIFSPVIMFSGKTLKSQMVLSKLGADETVTAGLVTDGFNLDSFFVRVEFR